MNTIDQFIAQRRAVFPRSFQQGVEVPRNTLEKILENANWAPSHKKTEPWRFVVFHGEGKNRLAEWMGQDYTAQQTPETFSDIKFKKAQENPLLSSAVIVIVMNRNEDSGLPEWEEIAAVACAVQNLWLSVSAYGLGGYWSSPGSINRVGSLLGLEDHQRCLGFFYIGVPVEGLPSTALRGTIEEKTTWITQ